MTAIAQSMTDRPDEASAFRLGDVLSSLVLSTVDNMPIIGLQKTLWNLLKSGDI